MLDKKDIENIIIYDSIDSMQKKGNKTIRQMKKENTVHSFKSEASSRYIEKNKLVKVILNDLVKRVIKKKQEEPNFNDEKYIIKYIWILVGIWVGLMIGILGLSWGLKNGY